MQSATTSLFPGRPGSRLMYVPRRYRSGDLVCDTRNDDDIDHPRLAHQGSRLLTQAALSMISSETLPRGTIANLHRSCDEMELEDSHVPISCTWRDIDEFRVVIGRRCRMNPTRQGLYVLAMEIKLGLQTHAHESRIHRRPNLRKEIRLSASLSYVNSLTALTSCPLRSSYIGIFNPLRSKQFLFPSSKCHITLRPSGCPHRILKATYHDCPRAC